MKITLNRIEAKAVEGARLFAARLHKDVAAIEQQQQQLEAQRQRLLAQANGHLDETLALVAERAGAEIPVDGVRFEKLKDGRATLEWPDAPPADPHCVTDELVLAAPELAAAGT